jgi:hypothetical protein
LERQSNQSTAVKLNATVFGDLDRTLSSASVTDHAADIFCELMFQMEKYRQRTVQSKGGLMDLSMISNSSTHFPAETVAIYWRGMFPMSTMTKDEAKSVLMLRHRAGEIAGHDKIGHGNDQWRNPQRAWYDVMRTFAIAKFGRENADAIYGYAITRRHLFEPNLSAEQDAKRRVAVEMAMQYVQLVREAKPLKKNRRPEDLTAKIRQWWETQVHQGHGLDPQEAQPEQKALTIRYLAEQAQDWSVRQTPVNVLQFIIKKTMHDEQKWLSDACADAQTVGMRMCNAWHYATNT